MREDQIKALLHQWYAQYKELEEDARHGYSEMDRKIAAAKALIVSQLILDLTMKMVED